MGEGPAHNPFAPPTEAADFELAAARYDTHHLATKVERFLGSLLDGLLYMAAGIPGFVAFLVLAREELAAQSGDMPLSVAVVFIGPLLLAAFQWHMVAKTGQTFAKRWLGMRIVLEDSGAPPGFVNGVLLRVWLFAAAGAIPVVGGCVGLADPLAIFLGERRQCLHDRVARTVVVRA